VLDQPWPYLLTVQRARTKLPNAIIDEDKGDLRVLSSGGKIKNAAL
jgi:hypothetical protein